MNIDLGFGSGVQSVTLPDKNVLAVLEANPVAYRLTGTDEVRRALKSPIGAPPLREIVRPGETVAIVTSDITRLCPTWKMLPPVLEELFAAGIRPEDVTVAFALGSHRAHTEAEQKSSWARATASLPAATATVITARISAKRKTARR